MEVARFERLAEAARRNGRRTLLETEALQVLEWLEIDSPAHEYVEAGDSPAADALGRLPGDSVVVKAVAAELLHKSAVGGVRVVSKTAAAVVEAMAEMAGGLPDNALAGVTLHELIPYVPRLGAEILLTARWTPEFGAVLVRGLGGVDVERLARRLEPGADLAITSVQLDALAPGAPASAGTVADELLSDGPAAPREALTQLQDRLRKAAAVLLPSPFSEIEINPLVFHDGRWLALDVVVRLADEIPEPMPERPLHKIERLLQPRSIAIVGVSRALNPGHRVLRNVLAAGYDPDRVFVIKRGETTLDGCRCVASIADLPQAVDLLVVGVGAERAVSVVEETVARRKAESLIVIAGGLGETEGTRALAAGIRAALAAARNSDDGGPVVNGANCLGVRSQAGGYDSLFLPPYKLGESRQGGGNAVFLSQSGALLAAKLSRLPGVDFRYCVSVGNQVDLTIGDYLTYLQEEPSLTLFAVYAEGFQPLDGLRFLAAAARIVRRGGTIVLYRGGRGEAGARAAASHTAALAGDYEVARALAAGVGVLVAESLEDFEDLIQLRAGLEPPAGRRVAVVTNAGFESVAAADHLGGLELAAFGDETRERLLDLLRQAGLEGVVAVSNPLDLTPMAADETFEEAVRVALADDGVDVGIVGCVPLTPALETLPAGAGVPEDLHGEQSIARRLVRLKDETTTPWAAVVDAGELYGPMRALLKGARVPTLDSIDRAARLLGTICAAPESDEPRPAR